MPRIARSDVVRALAVAGVRLAVTALDRARGVTALSDDDFARALIAERFAASPRLDPSGTSWLPLPFWIQGAVMRATEATMEVARATHAVLSALAIVLLYAGARGLGVSPSAATLGALLAVALPPAALLGSVPVPELPTAALAAFALVSVARRDAAGARRGALAILAATLCRYEAWPVAAVVAACVLRDPLPPARRAAWALVAIAGPVAWMAWNLHAHGDALHFFARVASYRRALGDAPRSPAAALSAWASDVARAGPWLVVLWTALAIAATEPPRRWLRRWTRPATGALALVAFLAVGEALGGAPTHHPERALLAAWLLVALLTGEVTYVALPRMGRPVLRAGLLLALLGALAVHVGAGADRADLAGRRAGEEQVGRRLRDLVPRGARVLVVTRDFGAHAVVAAFGRPLDATIDVTRADPRRGSAPDPLASSRALSAALGAANATWLVAPELPEDAPPLAPEGRAGALGIWRVR